MSDKIPYDGLEFGKPRPLPAWLLPVPTLPRIQQFAGPETVRAAHIQWMGTAL